jgi:hypothetical protein
MHSTFDPRPTVYHHHGRKAADFPGLMASYDRGRGAYYAKYLMRGDSRRAYLQGWVKDRFADVHRGSLASLNRELNSAMRYVLHRRRIGFLILAAPVAAGYYFALVGKLVARNVHKLARRSA